MADDSTALTRATVIGTAAQIGMVTAGHYSPSIANLFAPGGMGISLLAGVLYARFSPPTTRGAAARGGAIAGGVCAIIGIAISYVLGDVTASILLLGTLSSAVTGAIGGALARRQPVGS